MTIFLCVLWMLTVGIALRGWTIMQLWAWFMVPAFDINPLGFWHALGLGLFISFLAFQMPISSPEDNKEYMVRAAVTMTILPLICLVTGWLYHQFM